jgi:pimeloyl-ACP methyl ester carboxylesterase
MPQGLSEGIRTEVGAISPMAQLSALGMVASKPRDRRRRLSGGVFVAGNLLPAMNVLTPSHPERRRQHVAAAHRFITIDGVRLFYREAGPSDAPVVLLPHGYPCSSFQYRNLMPALADQWRLLAPDFPGFGYSDTPADFAYDFSGYADVLERFVETLGVSRFALYLHDYGSQIGLRLAMKAPQQIAALIVQNGDIYEDQLGPKYAELKKHFAQPTSATRAKLIEAVSEEGFRDEFLNEVRTDLAERIPADLWKLSWSLMNTPQRREIMVRLMEGLKENLAWFPKCQAYLRRHQPPTLIVWGPQDGYMPEGSARAYLRDLPEAELHLLDGGHWALETSLNEIVTLAREFLARVHA